MAMAIGQNGAALVSAVQLH
jgi:4a-hydroxytetrahydrobiopterin dehydratase